MVKNLIQIRIKVRILSTKEIYTITECVFVKRNNEMKIANLSYKFIALFRHLADPTAFVYINKNIFGGVMMYLCSCT